mmetsp:Transcript_51626/g.129521  ORF Transcript_51626/g.129521 Transcript_51626/m.129521 type:complete len:114 (-) Transcript_51626:200-541(-)|eukprot:CAMPEP_0177669064 /NCGR_PEP_ID=MMETSP0447-20121125/23199_1 /TAXON_ID=0 /ORGANISM="Stygamoeba regulata, Strain BSH-02190019" /LENGTH=113 /DNA_ID=CAMNT_0019175821 /DNA_START=161 /DNA_END=502 /DNA_ORIENTATION=+
MADSTVPYILTGALDTALLCGQAVALLLPVFVARGMGRAMALRHKNAPVPTEERIIMACYRTFVAGFVCGFGYLSYSALSSREFLSSIKYSGLPLLATPIVLLTFRGLVGLLD